MACVQDRLTCISQQVYSEAPESQLLLGDLLSLVEVPGVVVVHCRPPERKLMDLSTHMIKSYDTEESMERIARLQHEYIRKYDEIMGQIPHVEYDWTEQTEDDDHRIRAFLITTQHSAEAWKELRASIDIGKRRF